MITAAVLAAALLAPAGATAGIQGDPVCLPAAVHPGHSYPLSVSVSGSGPLALSVIPDAAGLHASLRQVPASWVSFAANPASPGQVAFTLAIPADAAPGAYWSDIEAAAGAQAQLGAAATTGLVFTVGPSSVPPPPCDALDLAQSTGKYPPWPSPAFRTTSWKQVYALLKGGPATPDGGPTATTADSGAHAVPAAAYSPAAAAPARHPLSARAFGWGVVIGALLLILRWFGRLLKGRK